MFYLFCLTSIIFWVLAVMGLENTKYFPDPGTLHAVVFMLLTAVWVIGLIFLIA